ncbi:hypothetical protein SRHO_G00174990 [Serrasalmus rhombeus]
MDYSLYPYADAVAVRTFTEPRPLPVRALARLRGSRPCFAARRAPQLTAGVVYWRAGERETERGSSTTHTYSYRRDLPTFWRFNAVVSRYGPPFGVFLSDEAIFGRLGGPCAGLLASPWLLEELETPARRSALLGFHGGEIYQTLGAPETPGGGFGPI